MAIEKPVPSALLGLCEVVLETRNILRSLAAVREHGTIPKAQVQARDELEKMKTMAQSSQRLVMRHCRDCVAPRS
jgi:hypothetical protein